MKRSTESPEQCVILIGGLGTRLGSLTAECPKPLLPIGKRPFLEELLWHTKRFGFRRVLLLAGHRADRVQEFVRLRNHDPAFSIEVVIEPEPLGTAGALAFAAGHLEREFLLLNGDSIFDFNWLDLIPLLARNPTCIAAMSVHYVPDASRYGVIELVDEKVSSFQERGDSRRNLINGGVYLFSKEIVKHLPSVGSLEREVLPSLSREGRLCARPQKGFFLDIGVPDTYYAAERLLNRHRSRPAVFFDRDGVLNVDSGYVHRIEEFVWIPGAIEAVKSANDNNYFVFLVTNQAGVARGHYEERDVEVLHTHIQQQLRLRGAHIDDIRYCPFHPKGVAPKYSCASSWRKPEPGMIKDLLEVWPVCRSKSVMIGDKATDIEAARRAGIEGLLFRDGNLEHFVGKRLFSYEGQREQPERL